MKTTLFFYLALFAILVNRSDLRKVKDEKEIKESKNEPDLKEVKNVNNNDDINNGENINKPLFKSFSSSRSYVYSNINGKESTKFDGLDLEKKGFKKGDKMVEEKYGRTIHKKNKSPLKIKEQASSTDEMENMMLGEAPTEYELDNNGEKQFLEKDPFFGGIKNKFLEGNEKGSHNNMIDRALNMDLFINNPINVGFEAMDSADDLFDQFMNKQKKKKSLGFHKKNSKEKEN